MIFSLFFDNSYIVNYADDNSPFSCNADIDSVISKLTNDSKTLLEWFCNISLKANPDKFHLIFSNSDEDKLVKIEHTEILNSNYEKLLGIKIDNKLSFGDHVADLCTKDSQKLHALSSIANFMNLQQWKKIMNAFINSQFGYCPLYGCCPMYGCCIAEGIILALTEYTKGHFVSFTITWLHLLMNVRNIQLLAVELYKVANGLSPEIMSHMFPFKENQRYPITKKYTFKSRNVCSVNYGTESLSHLGPKIWSSLPDDLKSH